MATMTATCSESEQVSHHENPAPARTFAPGWAPAALTDRGAAMCRLSEFIDAFEALSTEDRAWFAYPLSELLVTACEAERPAGSV